MGNVNGGGCLFPSCAAAEWYYNLLFEYSETTYPGTTIKGAYGDDNEPVDMGTMLQGGQPFPASKAAVESKLTGLGGDCANFLTEFKKSTFFQPTEKFDWNYAPTGGAVTTTMPSGADTTTPGAD